MSLTKKINCLSCKGTGQIIIADPAMLRELRLTRHIMLKDMASQLSIHPSYLSEIETGTRPCPDAILKAYQKL